MKSCVYNIIIICENINDNNNNYINNNNNNQYVCNM